MLRSFKIPITWTELIKRTVGDASEDNVFGLAAQLAYYFLLALVPAILCVAALASFLPPDAIESALRSISGVAPSSLVSVIREQLESVAGEAHGGLFTFGLLMSLWGSSAAIVSICDAMNRAYDIEEGRPWWKVRLIAIGLTIGLSVFVVAAFALVMIGPTTIEAFAAKFGLGSAFATAWKVLQWPVAFLLIAFAIAMLNYFAPDAEQELEWITPGSVLSTTLWVLASLGFKYYVSAFGNYETYGSLGGAVVLMLWFYISALAILIGSELNAEIEHASPYGKDPGEKVPGQRKKIGAAAAREYEKRKKQAPPTPPEPSPEPEDVQTDRMPPRWAEVAAYSLITMDLVRALRNHLRG